MQAQQRQADSKCRHCQVLYLTICYKIENLKGGGNRSIVNRCEVAVITISRRCLSSEAGRSPVWGAAALYHGETDRSVDVQLCVRDFHGRHLRKILVLIPINMNYTTKLQSCQPFNMNYTTKLQNCQPFFAKKIERKQVFHCYYRF